LVSGAVRALVRIEGDVSSRVETQAILAFAPVGDDDVIDSSTKSTPRLSKTETVVNFFDDCFAPIEADLRDRPVPGTDRGGRARGVTRHHRRVLTID
jgi:hypothetical protein